jgi:ATP-dependent RNA helicase DHX37/DHR1
LADLTKINPTWLSSLGKTLCTFSRPLELPSQAVQSRVAAASTNGGEKDGDERDVFVTPHFGALGVELPAIKAKQRRIGGRWVVQM